jgi:hypothetical protein
MLRLESNARAIDHNVIAQSSTNNGGMDFHFTSMAAWLRKCKLLAESPAISRCRAVCVIVYRGDFGSSTKASVPILLQPVLHEGNLAFLRINNIICQFEQ